MHSRGLPQMYGLLEEGWGLSTLVFVHSSICESYAVNGPSTDVWSIRGGGVYLHWYLCILLYVKVMQSRGLPQMYGQLEEGVRSICHGYMCILLFMKLIWCSGFPEIYAQLEEKGEDNLP